MWDKLVESENGSIGIERSESFYVGDVGYFYFFRFLKGNVVRWQTFF